MAWDMHTPCRGNLGDCPYTFVVNDTNSSTFYQPIYANSTDPQSRVIGELYQGRIFDASGNNRVGTNQGFAFNFGNSSAPYNDILFFGNAGELNTIDTYILSGSGDFEKFSGGYMPEWKILNDNPYIAELSLFESNVTSEDQTVLDELTFRITSEGGSTPIVGEEGQIGQTFQNRPVFQNGDQIGINQGYGFIFPEDPHISTRVMGNQQFLFDDGNKMTVLNSLVIEASGPYAKFKGTYLNQTIILEDPNFVADITLTAGADDEEDIEELYYPTEGTYDFKVTSVGGYKALIKNPEGAQIGERFQNPVYNNAGERVGTDQGYGFNFPTVEYTREGFQGNRVYYLNGGTLNLFNEVIAGATGKYRAYKGGRFSAKILSYNPVFEAEMTLVLPASSAKSESDQTKEESDEGSKDAGSSIEEDNMIEGEGVGKDKASSGGVFVLSPMIGLFLVLQALSKIIVQ